MLSAQHRRTDAHDELLFITVHQVYELWFKLLLFELEAARDAMLDGDIAMARHVFRRVRVIERLLVEQVDVLETMTPQDFMVFRSELEPASGFQSVQFREIEFLSGLKDPRYLERVHTTEGERVRLHRRLEEPSLWDAYLSLLERWGNPDLTEVLLDRGQLRTAVRAVRGPSRPRPGVRDLAGAARDDGGAPDRRTAGHRRLDRGRVPAQHRRPSVLPRALGRPRPPLSQVSVSASRNVAASACSTGSSGRIARSMPDQIVWALG